jgi:hypothetical protein
LETSPAKTVEPRADSAARAGMARLPRPTRSDSERGGGVWILRDELSERASQ